MDWELYDVPGAEEAARKLDAALDGALLGARPYDWESALVAYEAWSAVAEGLREFGALDTEPRAVAKEAIRERLGVGRGVL